MIYDLGAFLARGDNDSIPRDIGKFTAWDQQLANNSANLIKCLKYY